ncbi:MAG TPA: phage virion morphogenesis protein [Caldisericia bacterium]|nr:phage virion morphogenesis protein [Caldisericia bacterium]HPI84708.1 phage virion morphogenesis protein [Caldisericia bacterium]
MAKLLSIWGHVPVMKYASKGISLTAMLDAIATGMIENRRQRLSGQSDSEGSPLAPLSQTTIRKKGHSRILYDTGEMEDGLTYKPITGGIELTGDTREVMEKIFWAWSGSPNRPIRDFFTVGDDDMDLIEKIVGGI